MSTSSARALRIGVLLGGRLVEERVFRSPAPVTFGQSLRCALSIPAEGVPHEHVLFAFEGGRWAARVTARMEGRVASTTEVQDVAATATAIQRAVGQVIDGFCVSSRYTVRIHCDWLLQSSEAVNVIVRPPDRSQLRAGTLVPS